MDTAQLSPEMKKKILDISRDFFRYAENNLYIRDKDGNIIKFRPNKAQKKLIDRVLQLLHDGVPVRIIILKARQMGLSTAVEALIYWWVTTHKNITAMIIGHEDASSKNLYTMFKRYYENCNPIFQPTRKYNTKNDLVFDVDDVTKKKYKDMGLPHPGLGSIIKTSTAQNTSAGRSDTVQIIHGSEVGEWTDGEELVASLMQTVPFRPNTMIFLESTAKGVGNYFYKEWKAAVKGDSEFEPFFFPWWMHDEYELPGSVVDYTEEEKEIVDLMKEAEYDDAACQRKILFRRMKERNFISNPILLYQEYPSTAREAFLASGRPRFDIKALSLMEKLSDKHEGESLQYTLQQEKDRTITPILDPGAPLSIWELPDRIEEYVIGADVAEGVRGGDYSVADVIKKKNMKTVAKIRGHMDPDIFGHQLDKLGRFYNNALLGVEINNHGLAVVQRLRDLYYHNLYRREKGLDESFEESTSKLGWKTDMRTKPLMIDYLAEAIREGYVIDYDPVFVEEAMSYVVDDNGKTNAEEGSHDDTVIAKAIALQMFEWSNNNKANLKVYAPPKMLARKKQRKVIK